MFGFQNNAFSFNKSNNTANNTVNNPDFEVVAPPDDTVSSLKFSPSSISSTFLASGSWDSRLRCWEVAQNGTTSPKAEQVLSAPVLGICWHNDGSKIFAGTCDKQAVMWDLGANQVTKVAAHNEAVKSVHWIQSMQYSCLMTSSWDKTLKFWDLRSPNPILNIDLPERSYCTDVLFPMAVVGTAQRGLIVYNLDQQPKEYRRIDSPLKFQHRCVSIFKDANGLPTGFALGSVEGRVGIQYVEAKDPKENFTFKCHRSNGTTNNSQDIYAVNDIVFHPTYNTLVTVGSDGKFSFWDKDARTKLKTSDQFPLPISACAISHDGNIFGYALGYDWSKGHEFNDLSKKPKIYLRAAAKELEPRVKKSAGNI